MKTLRTALLAGAAVTMAASAQAAVLLSDNFNSETLQLNYTGFTNFDVTAGSVDLIGTPAFFDLYPGNGRYVDLDGSTGNGNAPAGQLTTKDSYGAGTYTLKFALGGSQRGVDNSVVISLGDFTTTILRAATDPLTNYSFTFTTASAGNLSFTNLGPSTQQGAILDNVVLASGVPELSTWAMMLIGFAGLGLAAGRRQRTAAALA